MAARKHTTPTAKKDRALKMFVETDKSQAAIAATVGVDPSQISLWIREAGLRGKRKKKVKRTKPGALKNTIIEMLNAGDAPADIVRKLKCDNGNVYRIRAQLAAGQIQATKPSPAKKAGSKKRGKTHHAHPRCPHCGYAMYKWMPKKPNVGASTKYPFAWCRNKECDKYGVDQVKKASKKASNRGWVAKVKKGAKVLAGEFVANRPPRAGSSIPSGEIPASRVLEGAERMRFEHLSSTVEILRSSALLRVLFRDLLDRLDTEG